MGQSGCLSYQGDVCKTHRFSGTRGLGGGPKNEEKSPAERRRSGAGVRTRSRFFSTILGEDLVGVRSISLVDIIRPWPDVLLRLNDSLGAIRSGSRTDELLDN
jgi:hypothetical protein